MNTMNQQTTGQDGNEILLVATLEVVVPLWVTTLQVKPWTHISGRLPYLLDMIASHGDNILYKSKKAGETANAFNALAEGIAICSFAPGGVRIFNRHWESKHAESIPQGDREILARVVESLRRRNPSMAERVEKREGL